MSVIGSPSEATSSTAAASAGRNASSLSAAPDLEAARVTRREGAELVQALLDVRQHVGRRHRGEPGAGERLEVRHQLALQLGGGPHHPRHDLEGLGDIAEDVALVRA